MSGEEVGTVVGFMHPESNWCHRDYSAISAHCRIGGPAPIALIRQSEAVDLIDTLRTQLAEAQPVGEMNAAWLEGYASQDGVVAACRARASTAEAHLAKAVEALERIAAADHKTTNSWSPNEAFAWTAAVAETALALINGDQNGK